MNYTPVSGTIQFAAGQTSATINVPVKDDGMIDGNFTFSFAITSVDNGASIGSPAAALVTIVNSDRDLTPPQVLSVVPVVSGNSILAYVVDFNKPLDPTRAVEPEQLRACSSPGRDLGHGQRLHPGRRRRTTRRTSAVTLVPVAARGR